MSSAKAEPVSAFYTADPIPAPGALEADSEPLYVFPLLNELHENIVSLAYRKDYPLPRHTMEFISASCMVFRNYSNSIRENFSPHSGRRE